MQMIPPRRVHSKELTMLRKMKRPTKLWTTFFQVNRNPAIFFWREMTTFSGDSKYILIDALKEARARSKINETIESEPSTE